MRTMLWKELRENSKWAFLALLALTAAELYTLSSPRQAYSEDFRDLTLCNSAFLLATAFGCSAIGVGLALVQILPELRRDQWAALLHRPVSRNTIFFGKVFAGLLLYAGAVVTPFFISTVYVAMPGQFAAPLVPGMLIPGLSDLLLGPVFYFATLLLCLHRGNWWGCRAAIGLSVIPIFVEHLIAGWPFLLPLLGALVYLSAAWGAMLSNGSIQGQPRAARLALSLVVMIGAETAILLVLTGLEFLPKNASAPTPMPYTNFEVGSDGQVYLATQNGDGTNKLTDAQGKLIPGSQVEQLRQNTINILPLSWQFHGSELRDVYFEQSPRTLANYLLELDEIQGKEIWYLLRAQNYFIGYDKLSRRAIGICDADGFKPPGALPRPFPHPLESSIMIFRSPRLFWMGSQVYLLDFPERSVVAFHAGDEPIYGANPLVPNYLTDRPLYIAAALATQLRLFDPNGTPLLSLPYPHDPRVWSSLSIGTSETGDRIYLESQATAYPWITGSDLKTPPPVFLDVYDPQGHLLADYQHPQSGFTITSESWTDRLSLYLSPFLPALAGTAYFNLFPSHDVVDGEELGYFTLPKPRLAGVAPGDLAILFGLDALLGVVAFAWARRHGFTVRRSTAWALFVACFGPLGLITFRLIADGPTRVRCPICGVKRPLPTNECPGCHRAWPAPALTGVEIFEGEKAAAITGPDDTAYSGQETFR